MATPPTNPDIKVHAYRTTEQADKYDKYRKISGETKNRNQESVTG